MHAKLLQSYLTLCNPYGLGRFLHPWASPGKNTGMGCHTLLQGIFLTQGLNLPLLCLLHWQAMFFTTSATGEAPHLSKNLFYLGSTKPKVVKCLADKSLRKDLHQEGAKAKKGDYLIGYSIKSGWCFVTDCPYCFSFVTRRYLRAQVLVGLHWLSRCWRQSEGLLIWLM